MTNNPPLQIYINTTENRITWKLILFWAFFTCKNKVTWMNWKKVTKDSENVSNSDNTEVALVHYIQNDRDFKNFPKENRK